MIGRRRARRSSVRWKGRKGIDVGGGGVKRRCSRMDMCKGEEEGRIGCLMVEAAALECVGARGTQDR